MSLHQLFKFILSVFLVSGSALAEIPPGYTGTPAGGTPIPVPGGIFHSDSADIGEKGVTYYHPGGSDYPGMLKQTGIDYAFDCVLPGFEDEVVINPGDKYWAYIEPGEWMAATIDVAVAGDYQVNMLMSNGTEDCQMLAVIYDGTDSISTGPMDVPYIGTCGPFDFHSWFVAHLDTVTLNAGAQVLRVETVTNGPFNVGWVQLVPVSETAVQGAQSGENLRIGSLKLTGVSLTAQFTTTVSAPAIARLFNAQGKFIREEALSNIRAGTNSISLEGRFADQGIYILRITQKGKTIEGRAALIR